MRQDGAVLRLAGSLRITPFDSQARSGFQESAAWIWKRWSGGVSAPGVSRMGCGDCRSPAFRRKSCRAFRFCIVSSWVCCFLLWVAACGLKADSYSQARSGFLVGTTWNFIPFHPGLGLRRLQYWLVACLWGQRVPRGR